MSNINVLSPPAKPFTVCSKPYFQLDICYYLDNLIRSKKRTFMAINSDLEHFAERCLKTVGLGPIFRLVVRHEISFDSIDFTMHIVKPMAERLGFVCKVVDLSRFTSIYEATNELGEIEGLLTSCDDEQRPLIVFQKYRASA